MASVREYHLSNGERTWKVLYRHGGRQSSRTFSSEKAADRYRLLVENLGPDRALAVLLEESSEAGVTLAELAREWLRWKARDVQPRTIADYERDYDNWIDPFLGHRAAAAITEADVQRWVDRDLSPRLSAKSIADRHSLLHGIFRWASAKARARVPSNPCLETELPKKVKGSPKGLTMPEWLALKAASRSVGEDAADLILFMASTGWRIGEATALTVEAVEDDGPKMYVNMRQVQRKGQGITHGGKTDAAIRRISVSGECAAMLRRRLVGLGPGDLVLTNRESPTGLWEPSTFRKRYWAKAVREANLSGRGPTPHWLRHTHVMLCHASGMTMAEIQRRIGHSDYRTTVNVYGRMIDEAPEDVMDKLDLLISGAAAPVLGQVVSGELE